MSDEVGIPVGPERPLEVERLRALVGEALFAAIRDLKSAPAGERDWLVHHTRSEDPQIYKRVEELKGPSYREAHLWGAFDKAARAPEGKALTEYIWNAGAMKKRLSGGDPATHKSAWDYHTWADLVLGPLLHLLRLSATRDLTERGTAEAWKVDPSEVGAAAEDVATAACTGRRLLTVFCPLPSVYLPAGFSATEISPSVFLRAWPEEEKCLFLTRYHREYHPEDVSLGMSTRMLEVVVSLPAKKMDDLVTEIASIVDRVRWALMASTKSEVLLREGAMVVRSASGWHGPTIRRQDGFVQANGVLSWPALVLDADALARASELLRRAELLAAATPDLKRIIWFFGRACLASTARDSILDAVIGLETLLVPGGGDSRYRFRLHGTALLSSVLDTDPDSDLSAFYAQRSAAAHGSETDFSRLASRARFVLSQAIVAAIELHENGELDPRQHKGDLAKAVEFLVWNRAVRSRRSGT